MTPLHERTHDDAMKGVGDVGYIEEIRTKVGHQPLILPGLVLLVIDSQHRVLFQRRREGVWGAPGGFMELDESAEDTGRREVKEETGLEIGAMSFLGVFSGKHTFFKLANGDEFYALTIAYLTREFTGQVCPDGSECIAADFYGLGELPSPVSSNLHDTVTSAITRFTEV